MIVKWKLLTETAKLPTQAHLGDAGFDIYASEERMMSPGHTVVIPTGLQLASVVDNDNKDVQPQVFFQVLGRSSLGLKGIFPISGIVDNIFRGEIKVILYNGSFNTYKVSVGDKVAQLITQKIVTNVLDDPKAITMETTDTVVETERNQNGFGSTGR